MPIAEAAQKVLRSVKWHDFTKEENDPTNMVETSRLVESAGVLVIVGCIRRKESGVVVFTLLNHSAGFLRLILIILRS